jgi:hypothetical protein
LKLGVFIATVEPGSGEDKKVTCSGWKWLDSEGKEEDEMGGKILDILRINPGASLLLFPYLQSS